MSQELQIITRSYDLLKWTLEHTARFDRKHRHGIGNRIETQLHGFLDSLVEAKYTNQKSLLLQQAGYRLEHTRLLYRLAKDLRMLGITSYGFAADQVNDLSGQLTAWRRSVDNRK